MALVFSDFYDPDCELYLPLWAYGAEQGVIHDQSGNFHTGIITAVAPSAGQCGTHRVIGWYFDGKGGNINHGLINFGKIHTMHYWLQMDDLDDPLIFHSYTSGDDAYYVQITDTTVGYNPNSVIATANHGGAATTFAVPTLISIVRVGVNVYFYQNGRYLGTDVLDDDNNMLLQLVGDGFIGNINDVYISHVQWTQLGIERFYEQTRRRYGNL